MSDPDMEELYRMQEDAKKRVMEMRNRSRFAADQMNRTLGAPPQRPAPPPPPGPKPEPPHSMPPGPKPEPPRPIPPKPGPITQMDREELERLFILSLCLLLAHEEADQSVLLGLLYLLT